MGGLSGGIGDFFGFGIDILLDLSIVPNHCNSHKSRPLFLPYIENGSFLLLPPFPFIPTAYY